MAKKKTSFIFSDLLIGLVISLVVLCLYFFRLSVFESMEYKFYDMRAKLRKSTKPSNQIVLVTIDDMSIANIGRWPWPRAIIGELVEKIGSYEPKVIGLNIFFTEAEQNAGLQEIKKLKDEYTKIIAQLKKEVKSKKNQDLMSGHLKRMNDVEVEIDNDAILTQSISFAGNVILPMYFNVGVPLAENQEEKSPILEKNAISNVNDSEKKNLSLLQGFSPTLPLDSFAFVSAGVGHSNMLVDADGVIRRDSPVIKSEGTVYPSFPLQLVRLYLGLALNDIKLSVGKELAFGNARIPLENDSTMFIDFSGPAQTYQYHSVFDVLTDKIPADVFKGKIVLVGYMATGLADLNVVPVGHNFPGSEIIANSIQNILDQRFIKRPKWAPKVELATLVICALFILILLSNLKAKWGAIVSAILLVLVLVPATYLFVKFGFWIKVFYSSSLLVFGYLIITSKRFLLTEKRKELVEAESIETNKMLGLSFQGQGMLDLAFEKFRKCPLDDSIKDLLYNLALDFERKRQVNKAIAVYEHIQATDPKFKDIAEKIKTLKAAGDAVVIGTASKAAKGGTVIVQSSASQAPTLGRYEIVKELGHGAMGVVYLGKDPKINRMVAIKTLQFEDDITEEEMKSIKQRFFREAESAGNLTHPNIIRIFDAGEDYDISYIAMELLDGEDLKKFCQKESLLPVKAVVDIIIKCADALDFAHKQGVIHRDIKPANIMMLKDGTLRIADFGIARVMASSKTQTGTVLGTPAYMSPEQIAGKKVDGRSDMFSLGVTFYELLTGEKPFKGDSIATLIFQISNETQQDPKTFKPDIPDCLVEIINKTLQKNPDNRYQSCGELEAALKNCLPKI